MGLYRSWSIDLSHVPVVVVACKPVLKLLPKIVDDHEALSAFRKVFDEEVASLKSPEVGDCNTSNLRVQLGSSCVFSRIAS